jgi:hypothetical protein
MIITHESLVAFWIEQEPDFSDVTVGPDEFLFTEIPFPDIDMCTASERKALAKAIERHPEWLRLFIHAVEQIQ